MHNSKKHEHTLKFSTNYGKVDYAFIYYISSYQIRWPLVGLVKLHSSFNFEKINTNKNSLDRHAIKILTRSCTGLKSSPYVNEFTNLNFVQDQQSICNSVC